MKWSLSGQGDELWFQLFCFEPCLNVFISRDRNEFEMLSLADDLSKSQKSDFWSTEWSLHTLLSPLAVYESVYDLLIHLFINEIL